MEIKLKVVDDLLGTSAPDRRAGISLRIASERASAREIIRSRVEAEVHEISQAKERRSELERPARSYKILADTEIRWNSPSAKTWAWVKSPDVEAEVKRATVAFARRRFIMLVDDRQIDDLDEAVGLRPESEVVFVHLTPLKGG